MLQQNAETGGRRAGMASLGQRLAHAPYLLLSLATLFWSGNFVLGRAIRADIPPVGLAFYRWLGASLLVFGFAWPHLKRDWPVIQRHRGIVLILALLGVTTFNTLVYTGLRSTLALNGVLMQSTMPVFIVVFSFLLFRETILARQALGIALSLTGVLAIVAQGQPARLLGLRLNIGDLLILIAVIAYSVFEIPG